MTPFKIVGKSLIRNEIFKLIIETNRLSQAAIIALTIRRDVMIVDMRIPLLVTMIIVNAVEIPLESTMMIVKEIERVATIKRETKRVRQTTNLTGNEIAQETDTTTSIPKTIKVRKNKITNGQTKNELIIKIITANLAVVTKKNAKNCIGNLIRADTRRSASGTTKVR